MASGFRTESRINTKIVRAYARKDVFEPEQALPLTHFAFPQQYHAQAEQLVRRGLLRKTPSGDYYLDRALYKSWKTATYVTVAVLIALFAGYLLYAITAR